ncbi:MAG: prepilin peptidase [Minisyncoccia bacterium]
METLFIIYVTVLGFVLGSFLNVVSLRFNTGKSLSGRSMCFSCGKKLSWHELVPVLSWLLQRGRCRGCSSRIPVELLASEILCGSFFTLIALRGFFTNNFTLDVSYLLVTIYLLVVFCILCVVFFYDLRHQIIPDELSGLFAVITFIGLFFKRSS